MHDATRFYECDGCGACCAVYSIFASREDPDLEPRIASESQGLSAWLETPARAYRLYPLPFHEACCFLDSANRCTIYQTRRAVWREFAAGSEDCQTAWAARNLPALLPVMAPAMN
jgi:Fe-S-cluster containining protein